MRAAAVTLLLMPAAVAAQPSGSVSTPNEFEFARTKVGRFEIRGTTTVNWRGRDPSVDKVTCTGDNGDLRFFVGDDAQLQSVRFAFRGSPEPDGEREEATLLGDTLWLFVDGKRYEFRNIPKTSRQFVNHAYPPGPEIILPVWHGYRAVRASASEPFMNIAILHGALLRAGKIEWAFKSRNWSQVDPKQPENALPKGWQSRRYAIDTTNFKAAVEWCIRAADGASARHLPAGIKR